jgi:hypothetical protein
LYVRRVKVTGGGIPLAVKKTLVECTDIINGLRSLFYLNYFDEPVSADVGHC